MTKPQLFDVKHVRDDLHKGKITDQEVYDLAVQLQRLIVTYNAKDFREFAKRSHQTGVIAVSANVPLHQIDTKLTALLMRSSEKALQGKYTVLFKEATKAA